MAENVADKWINIPLGECGQIVSGGTPSTKISEYWNGDIAWITPADLSGYTDKYIARGRKSITAKGLQNSSARLMPPGSVLFSSRAPVGYVAIAAGELCTNQGFKSLIPYESIDNTYLYYFFKFAKDSIEDQASGTTFKEISAKTFSQISVPVPPLPEQRRIVSRIEELFSELDKGVETLKTLQHQLKAYRQAVLKSAFEGRLTEDWRNYSRSKIPSNMPTKWPWARLSQIAERIQIGPFGSQLHQYDYQDDGLPIINPKHIQEQRIKPEERISKGKALELPQYILAKNDIVMGRRGQMGRSASITEKEEGWICGTGSLFIRLGPNYNSKLYSLMLSTKRVVNYLEQSSRGTTMTNLNLDIIKNLCVPVISLIEQEIIIQEIESRLSVSDKLEETIEQTLKQAEALRQSILKKAFEGCLLSEAELEEVRREPDWEPASVLLEKIKAHKASIETVTPTKKTARKGKKQT